MRYLPVLIIIVLLKFVYSQLGGNNGYGYYGESSFNIDRECVSRKDCSHGKACVNMKCEYENPCLNDTCGVNAVCHILQQNPICFCYPGYYGDPNKYCSDFDDDLFMGEKYEITSTPNGKSNVINKMYYANIPPPASTHTSTSVHTHTNTSSSERNINGSISDKPELYRPRKRPSRKNMNRKPPLKNKTHINVTENMITSNTTTESNLNNTNISESVADPATSGYVLLAIGVVCSALLCVLVAIVLSIRAALKKGTEHVYEDVAVRVDVNEDRVSVASSHISHIYETIADTTNPAMHTFSNAATMDISQRVPSTVPEEEYEETKPYIHYDTPYEYRIFRIGVPVLKLPDRFRSRRIRRGRTQKSF